MLSFIPNDVVHATYFGPAPMGKFTDPIDLINDEVVKISAILLKPSCPIISEQHKELSRPLGPLLPHLDSPNRNGGPVPKQGDISVIYICELPEIKGKFDKAKANALGLKPGPKYRELQLGNSVMSDEKNVTVGEVCNRHCIVCPKYLAEVQKTHLNLHYLWERKKLGSGPET